MIRDLLALALIAGAGWLLWQNRDQLGGLVDQVRGTLDPAPSGEVDRIGDVGARAHAYARQAGIPIRDQPLVAAIITIESGGDPLAHNTDGEDSRGLMQVQLSTAEGLWDLDTGGQYGLRRRFGRAGLGQALFDPVWGVVIGHAYLRYLRERVPAAHRQAAEDWVIRAYNGGEFWHERGTGVRAATLRYLEAVNAALGAQQAREVA